MSYYFPWSSGTSLPPALSLKHQFFTILYNHQQRNWLPTFQKDQKSTTKFFSLLLISYVLKVYLEVQGPAGCRVSHHVSPGTELEQDFHFIFAWNRRVQTCISTIQEPKEHKVNGDKEVRYSNYFLVIRWDFKVENTFGKRNLNICMNELFKFCLMHTDFLLPRLSLKPQDTVDLKKPNIIKFHRVNARCSGFPN